MLGQIGLAFGCVNYLSTPTENTLKTSPVSRQRIHPEDSTSSKEKLAIPRKASPEDKSPSPNPLFDSAIQPKISPYLASEFTPTTESKTMTLYGYNAAAKLPFAFSHSRERVPRGGERRSLRSFKPPSSGRMVRSASSGAAPHAPPLKLVARPHSPGPHRVREPPPNRIRIRITNKNRSVIQDIFGCFKLLDHARNILDKRSIKIINETFRCLNKLNSKGYLF